MNKILIVDDNKKILQGIARILHGKWDLDLASSASLALYKVKNEGPYSVILTDMLMPGMNGVELLEKLELIAPNTVKVMLTGSADPKIAVDAINLGKVYKFLQKPIGGIDLKNTIETADDLYNVKMAEINENVHKEHEINDLTSKLRFQYEHDVLTGLLNRSTFAKKITEAIDGQKNNFRALCYLDIDHFLIVNDSVGVVGGDELLKQISILLLNKAPTDSILARLGGDGFGLLLREPLSKVAPLIEKIRLAINGHLFKWQRKTMSVSASFGLISIDESFIDVDTLLGLAENACCIAKENGRNRAHFANKNDNLLTKKMNDIHWVNLLSNNDGMDKFVLYHQEIRSIVSNGDANKHYEILLRYVKEDGEIVLPGEFLIAAEHYQISPKIDRWVILNCAQLLSKNLDDLSLCSINLSGHSINEPGMEHFINDTFSRFKIPKNKICFELTETAAIGYFSSAVEFMSNLKKQGFIFALDDFGTGLSSYEYLKSLPVDILKIDGSFVRNMDKDNVDFTLTKSMCEVGKAMGLKIVAECVENENVFKLLQEIGIDYAQGYYLDTPSIFQP